MKIFGPFSRDFLVPWNEIRVTRKKRLFWEVAELRFGDPEIGKLSLAAYLADRLAQSAAGRWPEVGPFVQETKHQVLVSIVTEWAAITSVAALFFIVAPRMADPDGPYPPIVVAIVFPAIVFGFVSIWRYVERTRR